MSLFDIVRVIMGLFAIGIGVYMFFLVLLVAVSAIGWAVGRIHFYFLWYRQLWRDR